MTAKSGVFGAAAYATETAEQLVLGTVRDTHLAIAERTWRIGDLVTGGRSLPHRVHDTLSRIVYGSIGVSLRGTSKGFRTADAHGFGGQLEATARGRFIVSAVNGLIGDRLVDESPELAIQISVRHNGHDIPLEPEQLAKAFPEAGEDLVVFVHGLSESEAFWDRRREQSGGNYGERLAYEQGWSPVFLRVNTGLPIAENGVALASLLDKLVEAWPTDVRRVALVGHSMGGLIVRAACAVSTFSERPWNELVTNVVLLGTPNLGAPLERAANFGARALGILPESAPFGRILEYRSSGILDLRNGLAHDVQNLPHARYHLVGATLTKSIRHPVAEVFGDLLVQFHSATGRPRRGREMFPGADILHVPKADHFDLLNHPKVYNAMKGWLA
ncbi:MAG: alpha/beta hydrolase [Marmoricola sp.]|nr:alpha/beta hydrolase [Marmoricola sp.]